MGSVHNLRHPAYGLSRLIHCGARSEVGATDRKQMRDRLGLGPLNLHNIRAARAHLKGARFSESCECEFRGLRSRWPPHIGTGIPPSSGVTSLTQETASVRGTGNITVQYDRVVNGGGDPLESLQAGPASYRQRRGVAVD